MIVTKLEESIDKLMSAISEAADLQVELDNAKSELAMFSMLYQINQYINTNLEISKLIPLVEDVVLGLVGANYCAVLLEESTGNQKNDFGITLDYKELMTSVPGTMLIEDLSVNPMLGMDKGSFYINKIDLAEDTCGFILVYWTVCLTEKDKKVQFLSILSTQVGLAIKNAKLMEKLTSMALHDPLTGIFNRTKLNNIESSSIPTLGECTIMFDLDDFKKINDTNGHTFGDMILKEFANVLSNIAKEANASCFRFGGEEFVLKCDCSEWEGLQLANKVREQFTLKTGYTVSAGVSAIGESCKLNSYKTLIELADAAMYISKQSGKNRATISNSDLQLYEKGERDLSDMLNKFNKEPKGRKFSFLRMEVTSNCALSADEFEEYKIRLQRVCNGNRIYVTEALAAFISSEQPSDFSMIIQDIHGMMTKYYPSMAYTLYDCEKVFEEVLKHSSHVADLVRRLGLQLNMSEADIDALVSACEWHDVGKLCIDPSIFLKPGALTKSEYERVKNHAWLGYSIAKHSNQLQYFADWILMHHEDYDGKGYYGYKGGNIPLPVQVMSIMDKLDALTEDRCYRKAYSLREAIDIIKTESDKFNPELLERFLDVVAEDFQK